MSGGGYLSSEDRAELGSSVDMSGEEVVSSVRISIEHGDGNHEGSPLGYVLGPGFRDRGGSSHGRKYGEES